jgi:putative PIN family toxin of toxin-antitoxin system
MSNEILAESSRVLRYPRMRVRHGMSESRIYDYVMFLQSVATMVRPDPALMTPIRDPNDIVVLQTAITGGAEAICTTDEDFFHTPALAFLRSVSILVFTDMELMGRLRS